MKSYPRFSKISKNNVHLNNFFILLYDSGSNLRHIMSINKLLKNVSLLEMGKTPTVALCSEITKCEICLTKQRL